MSSHSWGTAMDVQSDPKHFTVALSPSGIFTMMNTQPESSLKTYSKTYEELDAELYHKGHGGEMQSRRVGNNTKLQRRNGNRIAVQLHDTDVLTYWPDNRVVLNAASWYTVTTKDRMNAFLGWYTVHSHRSEWSVSVVVRLRNHEHDTPWSSPGKAAYIDAVVPFENGMTLSARTHEIMTSPNDYLTAIDDSLVLREVSDLSRSLTIEARTLEDKAKEGTIIRADLNQAVRLLDAYQREREALLDKTKALESSMDWASARLEDVITAAISAHADQFLEMHEAGEEITGQERLRDFL